MLLLLLVAMGDEVPGELPIMADRGRRTGRIIAWLGLPWLSWDDCCDTGGFVLAGGVLAGAGGCCVGDVLAEVAFSVGATIFICSGDLLMTVLGAVDMGTGVGPEEVEGVGAGWGLLAGCLASGIGCGLAAGG